MSLAARRAGPPPAAAGKGCCDARTAQRVLVPPRSRRAAGGTHMGRQVRALRQQRLKVLLRRAEGTARARPAETLSTVQSEATQPTQLDTNFFNLFPGLTGTDIWIRANNIVGKQRHIAILKLFTNVFGFDNQTFPSVHLGITSNCQ